MRGIKNSFNRLKDKIANSVDQSGFDPTSLKRMNSTKTEEEVIEQKEITENTKFATQTLWNEFGQSKEENCLF